MNETKARTIYVFTCKRCKNSRRMTFKESLAAGELCRKCRKFEQAHKNQEPLFEGMK